MQEFTLDVSAEEMPGGGPFTRWLLTGPFHPSSKVDYCDPSEGTNCLWPRHRPLPDAGQRELGTTGQVSG